MTESAFAASSGPGQRVGFDQRHVAVEDQRGAFVVQLRHGLLHRVAGAQLRLLAHEGEAGAGEGGLDLRGAVAGDRHGAIGLQRRGGVDDMLK